MNWFRLKTCIKCQGDLMADDGDWLCLQCGTYYYTGLYQLNSQLNDEPQVSNPRDSDQFREKLMGVVKYPDAPVGISVMVTAVAEPAAL